MTTRTQSQTTTELDSTTALSHSEPNNSINADQGAQAACSLGSGMTSPDAAAAAAADRPAAEMEETREAHIKYSSY